MSMNLQDMLKIRISQHSNNNNSKNIIRIYHSPHEVIVRPKAKKVEILEEDGIGNETYNLVDKKLSWIEDEGSDSSEIILDLLVNTD